VVPLGNEEFTVLASYEVSKEMNRYILRGRKISKFNDTEERKEYFEFDNLVFVGIPGVNTSIYFTSN
jgi:hypothetical protein